MPEDRPVTFNCIIMHFTSCISEHARKYQNFIKILHIFFFDMIYGLAVPDALIASTAISLNAELVTRNLKHYELIEELTIKDIG